MVHSKMRPVPRPSDMPEFDRVLADLEDEVGVPVLSGEARRWSESIVRLFDRLDHAWRDQVQKDRATLEETMRTDAELSAQVEKMCQREEIVARELEDLKARTGRLCEASQNVIGGAEPVKQLEEIRGEWMTWIVSCRALAKEIRTWLVESIYRDTGGGD
jgi:hypothetical protein